MSQWRNWSGSVTAHPEQLARPRTAANLAALLINARKVRIVGAGHSFMPLCETPGTLISLADYEGQLEIAEDRKTVWAPAGWGLSKLTAALWDEGLSLINQGDINAQSLAGATSTGTHGTGADLGSLSAQTCGFRVMLASGEVVECSSTVRRDLYEAQRLSLGLMGVALAIRIHVTHSYHLEEKIQRLRVAEVVERLPELAAENRHVEFFVFPYSDYAILKTLHPRDPEGPFEAGSDIDETAFNFLCDVGARVPSLIPSIQRLMMKTVGKPTRRVGPAFQVFPSERKVLFEEMEYELPRQNGLATLQAVIDFIRKRRLPIAYPFEYRLVASDDIWLSPFNRGPGASISLHQYAKMPWATAFAEIEKVFQAGDGRPHWAKRHSLAASDVHRLYPKVGDFLRVRAAVDPQQKFANSHLTQLFGLCEPERADP